MGHPIYPGGQGGPTLRHPNVLSWPAVKVMSAQAYLLLTLAYPGVKFVTDVILA